MLTKPIVPLKIEIWMAYKGDNETLHKPTNYQSIGRVGLQDLITNCIYDRRLICSCSINLTLSTD